MASETTRAIIGFSYFVSLMCGFAAGFYVGERLHDRKTPYAGAHGIAAGVAVAALGPVSVIAGAGVVAWLVWRAVKILRAVPTPPPAEREGSYR